MFKPVAVAFMHQLREPLTMQIFWRKPPQLQAGIVDAKNLTCGVGGAKYLCGDIDQLLVYMLRLACCAVALMTVWSGVLD